MKCYGEIDFKRSTIDIEEKLYNLSTELKRNTISIDRLVSLWLIEKQVKKVLIVKDKYKIISVHVPFFTDWVILQNDYLPIQGEYFLN
jgi:hypothetical protein